MIGSLDSHDLVARNLCAGAGAVVASVDYRMGPEHRFPAAVEDSFAALRWVHANAASLGADPLRIGVHGDSAGANLAAVVALMARDAGGPQLRLQSLVYPVADYTMAGASYGKYSEGCGVLTKDAMAWFRDHYLRSAADAEDWRASPLKARHFAGVAPAVVVAAECDVLHDEGARLRRGAAPRRDRGRIPGISRHDPRLFWLGAAGRRRDDRPAPGLGRLQTRLRLSAIQPPPFSHRYSAPAAISVATVA